MYLNVEPVMYKLRRLQNSIHSNRKIAGIEAATIKDYNVFGAKCHIMPGATIGIGCVICPRVMIIAKKRIRDGTVIFGDNMVHEQPLMKKRNRAYIEQMVKVLRAKFKEIKKKPPPGSQRMPTRNSRNRQSSAQKGTPSQNRQSSALKSSASQSGKSTYSNKSRPEVAISKRPQNKFEQSMYKTYKK